MPNNTYFRLINGPAGYDKNVKAPGGTFTLSSPGAYYLGIQYQNSTTVCAIDTIEINYAADPLSLDVDITAAYVCVGESTGNITVSGINGVAPFIYQLWDAANTTQLIGDTYSNDVVHFAYGAPNQTYTVRVRDQCGNNFNQQVTLSDLNTVSIVYAPNGNSTCDDGTIEIRCITLGDTEYSWTGPNGFTASTQHITIENATSANTGWYYVSVKPEYCGAIMKDSIYFTVSNDLSEEPAQNYEFCLGSESPLLDNETTGGSGNYTYQWQSSLNGSSGWTNIGGATNETYQTAPTNAGTLYFRRVTTDTVCEITSNGNPITVVVKACSVPVNPHLMILYKD
jgi:hypothetical protein